MPKEAAAQGNGAMAKYFLYVKVFSRGKGSRVTRAAAYRAGERIHDDRTSESYNYSDRRDIPHKEIVLPSLLAGRTDMSWARTRSTLWNAVEHAGQRRNARLAREVLRSAAVSVTFRNRSDSIPAKPTIQLAGPLGCTVSIRIGSLKSAPVTICPGLRRARRVIALDLASRATPPPRHLKSPPRTIHR